MKKYLFLGGCHNPLFMVLIGAFIASQFMQNLIADILEITIFLGLGALCLTSYYKGGMTHCKITGYGFIGVGAIIILMNLDIINVPSYLIWIITSLIIITAFGKEIAHKRKEKKNK